MKRRGISAIFGLFLSLAATSANAAQVSQQSCMAPDEAKALVVVVLPSALQQASESCAPVLPRGAFLRHLDPNLLNRYAAAAPAAMPRARRALAMIVGDDASAITGSMLLMPMVQSIVVAMVKNSVKPKDCAVINSVVRDVAPLPAENIASLIVTLMQVGDMRDKDLPICPMKQQG